MNCVYCGQRQKVERSKTLAEWVVSCECASVNHPWLELAERKCIVAAYKKNRDNPSVPIADMEPDFGDASTGEV